MIYKSPELNNKSCYVPIVVKNKDYLTGYLHAMGLIKELIYETFKRNNIDVDLENFELCLDSSRFNDVMTDGRRERDLSEEELKKYYIQLVESKVQRAREMHPENDGTTFKTDVLKVECPCGLGVYSYKSVKDIPSTQKKCDICGQVIIDYNNHYDFEYDYDGGKTRKRGTYENHQES